MTRIPSPETPVSGDAIGEIAAERRRQIKVEGWTPEHDDTHGRGEMAVAAACYADPRPQMFGDPRILGPVRWNQDLGDWDWNPKDRRSNLIRAGALIVAEIERLDRARGKR
jgi:hypothetical protein